VVFVVRRGARVCRVVRWAGRVWCVGVWLEWDMLGKGCVVGCGVGGKKGN